MQIPKPGTRALLLIGDPIYVNASANDDEMTQKLAELQRALDHLKEKTDGWLKSG